MSISPTNESILEPDPPPSSVNDVTIAMKGVERAPQPSSCDDGTIDLPQGSCDSSDFTIDHMPTQKSVEGSCEDDDKSFVLDEASCGVSPDKLHLVANYEILDILGRGAAGVVYKARQLGLKRLCALKMLLAGAHASPRELMRFSTEAEAVARCHHPNIVQVYEVGKQDGLPYFSLEYVEGGSLAQKINGKPMPADEAAILLEMLARAMQYAHEQHILHRDLKPANILLTTNGIPKITDFGLAKRLEEGEEASKTRTGTLMGTPSYMAPEQAEGRTKDIGPLSDQYALGAILYETLTGRPPFLGATLLDTLHQVRTHEPVAPSRLLPSIPRDLEIICLKCLQKEPAKRYGSAGELADDLKRFLSGEPIRARPVSAPERTWRWCRRNPRTAALSAAVILLLTLLAVSGGVLTLHLIDERHAIDSTRLQTKDQLKSASDAVLTGDFRRAKLLLQYPDPLLESEPALQDQGAVWFDLKDRIDRFADFKTQLDQLRFAYIYGSRSRKDKEKGRQYLESLWKIYDYDAIALGTALADCGLPPLNPEQQQVFKEDVFDVHVLAILTEGDLTREAGDEERKQVARRSMALLDRAEKILPGTRTVRAHRAGFLHQLGREQESKAYFDLALDTKPTFGIDHFWHGYADHLRGDGARDNGKSGANESYHKELAEYVAMLRLHPDNFWGYFSWAVAKVTLGEPADAVFGFTNCIRLRPESPWPYNNRGTAHLRLKQFDLAIQDYTVALQLDPKYLDPYINRAWAYLERGNFLEAEKDCNHVLQLDPHYVSAYWRRAECYRRLKQHEKAVADFTKLLDLEEDKVEVYLKRAAVYRELNRPYEALRDYTRAVELEPKNTGHLLNRAAVYKEMNRLDDALRDYDRVLTLEPKNAWGHYVRSQLYVQRGEYQKAVEEYTATLALRPDAGEPYRERGIVYWLHLKDFDSAVEDWQQVAKIWPSKAESYRCLGEIYLGRRQYDLALTEVEKSLAREANNVRALSDKAQIYLFQGKAKAALEVVNAQVEKLQPGSEELLNVRGDIYRRLGRLEEAAADYRRLLRVRPDFVEAYLSLALVYLKQGQAGKACECLDQLITANPHSAAAFLLRGRCLRDQGKFDEAVKDFKQAAHCEPALLVPALLQASVSAARGNHAAAAAEAETILKKAPKDDGQVLYAAVQVWSWASAAAAKEGKAELARQYADRAADFLAQALDKGFHDLHYAEHNRLIDDPALESIRQHPRVRELLAQQAEPRP